MDDLPGVAGIQTALTQIEGEVVAALASMVDAAQEDRKRQKPERRVS